MDHKLISYFPTFPQKLVARTRVFFLIINPFMFYCKSRNKFCLSKHSTYISKTAKMLTLPNDASIEETTGCIWRPSTDDFHFVQFRRVPIITGGGRCLESKS